MIKKTITYTDYDGVDRKEDFYFNLTKIELMEMEVEIPGGLEKTINRISSTQDGRSAMALFKEIIMRSYGEKSPDGRRFIKSKELSEGFVQTEAYAELISEFLTDPDKASAFIQGIIPAKLAEMAAKADKSTPLKLS